MILDYFHAISSQSVKGREKLRSSMADAKTAYCLKVLKESSFREFYALWARKMRSHLDLIQT